MNHGNGVRLLAVPLGLEQERRQRRAQRQRVEGRNHRRDGDRQGELPEELARDARNERAGNEHRAQHQTHGDDRAGDQLHRAHGRVARRKPVFDMMFDRLDHHDRVVDHDADGQHQAEEREIIEAEAQPP